MILGIAPASWIAALLLWAAGPISPLPSLPENAPLPPPAGRVGVAVPEAVTAGTFDGTWWYVCRDFRLALWIRTVEGKPEMKLEYQSLQAPESFETDWSSKSTYYLAGQPVTFTIDWSERGPDRMKGLWNWVADVGGTARTHRGALTVHRTGDGRWLAFQFQDLEFSFRRGDKTQRFVSSPVWGFRKASKRIDVLWDEIPF